MNRAQRRGAAKGSRQGTDVRAAADALHRQGLAAYQARRHAEAAELIGRAIRAGGENADYLCNLGVVLKAGGRSDAALEQFERAIMLDPRHVLALGNRGNLLAQLGRLPEAAGSYRAALVVASNSPGVENNLGNVLRQSGQADEAAAAYRRAIDLAPGYIEALGNLGSLLTSVGRFDEAIDYLQRALALRPDDLAAHANLGSALSFRRDYAGAERHYRAAIASDADFAVAHAGLGDVLGKLGRTEAAAESYQAALKLKPDDPATLSALLFLRNYSSDANPAEMTATARAYGDVVGRGIPAPQPYANDPDPERRLRIGLVSGDFRAHAVSSFLRGVLPALWGGRLDLFAYATSALRDQATETLAGMVGHWRDAAGLDNEALAATIRADAIDILIDLSGHTMFNRLPVFARRPAPVQVTWLGYSGTTGLGAIDYILGDRWVTPDSEVAQLAETPWRLPDSYLCFAPPALPVEVGPAPADDGGPITFGSFNNINKLSELTIAAWARVLGDVPESRLLLKHRMLEDADIATGLCARFTAHGIRAERLLLKGRDPTAEAHLRSYDLVDIALDPFPYNGTTTTVEALWMGVPVLGLKGERFIAHVGESILHTAGLGDWVTSDADAYVAKATAFAADRRALAALRQDLRPQLLASPLCDAPRFARHLETAFHAMWKLWCARPDAQAAKNI
jgi:protein O-GlcNAc transferase